MDERDFTRFEFKMSFGRISYIAHCTAPQMWSSSCQMTAFNMDDENLQNLAGFFVCLFVYLFCFVFGVFLFLFLFVCLFVCFVLFFFGGGARVNSFGLSRGCFIIIRFYNDMLSKSAKKNIMSYVFNTYTLFDNGNIARSIKNGYIDTLCIRNSLVNWLISVIRSV